MKTFTETHGDITIRTASRAELPAALRVQRAGFTRVANRMKLMPGELPPVRETLEEIETLFDQGMVTFLATVSGTGGVERVVGTVRGFLRKDGTVEIGRLAVDDGFLRRGIASMLMLALEKAFPQARRFELFTGSEASEPLALYAKLGYRIYERESFEHWEMVRLEKDAATATPGARLH